MTTTKNIRLSADQLVNFARDVESVGRHIQHNAGAADIEHLLKVERWGRISTLLGVFLAWFPNPISVLALALGRSTRWMIYHHISHGAYEEIPNVPERFRKSVFAQGKRRYLDWLGWVDPAGWDFEHNVLHHGFTGQDKDPDLHERNAESIRNAPYPKWVRYLIVGYHLVVGNPKTIARRVRRTLEREASKRRDVPLTRWQVAIATLRRAYLPHVLFFYVLYPMPFLLVSKEAAAAMLLNSVLADVVVHIHMFIVLGSNHTANDLYRFDSKPGSRGEYFVQQIIGTSNYCSRNDFQHWALLWLNFQIEHHLWPRMTMHGLKQAQPKVRELCCAYGIPYIEERIWTRFGKMTEVLVGTASMKVVSGELNLPTEPSTRASSPANLKSSPQSV